MISVLSVASCSNFRFLSVRTIKLTLAYDGTNFAGWQIQAAGRTVQGVLEAALARVAGEAIRVAASGRTDSGVHALGQGVSFEYAGPLPADDLARAINAYLPEDAAVTDAADAPPGFHARRSAARKRYRYRIYDGPVRAVFERSFVWQCRQRLCEQAMARAAAALVGTHDFASFQTAGSPRESTVRTVYEIAVRRGRAGEGDEVVIEVEADGFLYNMVRGIVGTLVEVGRGAAPEELPAAALAARDRRAAGPNAPAAGLCLLHVTYPDDLV